MRTEFNALIHEYREINKLASQGETVFMGGTFLHDFPFAELSKKLCVDEKIYNRSICGLSASDAIEVYSQAVSPLKPKNLFIGLGENENGVEFIDNYRKLINYIKADSLETTIMLVSVFSDDVSKCRFNDDIRKLAQEMGVVYIDAMEKIIGADGRIMEHFLSEGGKLSLSAYITYWRRAYHYMRKSCLSYCDAISLSDAAMMG